MRKMLFLMLVLCGPACAAELGYLPVNHQRIVAASHAEVWRRLHAFLRDEGLVINHEDVGAGTIDAQRSALGAGSFRGLADCPPRLLWRFQHEMTDLTISVEPDDDGAKVTAHAAFTQTARPSKKGLLSRSCVSQGVLERAVLDVASGQPMESAIVPH